MKFAACVVALVAIALCSTPAEAATGISLQGFTNAFSAAEGLQNDMFLLIAALIKQTLSVDIQNRGIFVMRESEQTVIPLDGVLDGCPLNLEGFRRVRYLNIPAGMRLESDPAVCRASITSGVAPQNMRCCFIGAVGAGGSNRRYDLFATVTCAADDEACKAVQPTPEIRHWYILVMKFGAVIGTDGGYVNGGPGDLTASCDNIDGFKKVNGADTNPCVGYARLNANVLTPGKCETRAEFPNGQICVYTFDLDRYRVSFSCTDGPDDNTPTVTRCRFMINNMENTEKIDLACAAPGVSGYPDVSQAFASPTPNGVFRFNMETCIPSPPTVAATPTVAAPTTAGVDPNLLAQWQAWFAANFQG